MDTLSKVCTNRNCQQVNPQPLSHFYERSGYKGIASEPGHYVSECKTCMRERARTTKPVPKTVSSVYNERLAIEYLRQHGIYAAPGKSVYASDVDVVAFGCVWIEVKHSRYEHRSGRKQFAFVATPKQQERGYRAHLVMLICEYSEQHRTYHLFDARDEVLYIKGRVKSGLTYYPDRTVALKHAQNRVVMTRSMMDSAQDNVGLIWRHLKWVIETLKDGGEVLPDAI